MRLKEKVKMVTRLSQYARDEIGSKLLKRAFDHRFFEFKAELAKLHDAVYHYLYNDDELQKMEAMPDGFLVETDSILVRFGDDSMHASNFFNVQWTEPRRVAVKHDEGRTGAVVIPTSHPLVTWSDDIKERRERLEAEKEHARRQTVAMLRSYSTLERLIQAWPEVEPFAAPFQSGNLPPPTSLAIPHPELNKALGLIEA